MQTGVSVRQVMVRGPLYAPQRSSVRECAKRMANARVGSLLIIESGVIKGIVTEQDIARKIVADNLDPDSTHVDEIMSKPVLSVDPDQDIYEAMVTMGEHEIKHLPVMEKNKLVGIVSFKDIIHVQPGLIEVLNFKNSLTDDQKEKFFREK